MAENDFLPFAAAAGANVLDQATYAAASDTSTGFVSGVASSKAVNKTLRQASIIAAVIAQFIVDNAAADVIDDGTTTTIEDNFVVALQAVITGMLAGYAKLASPTFTGTPAGPTAAAGTNTTQLASTAFVQAALSGFAKLAGPAFTGTPTAPTAAAGTNTTQIATTAFVQAAISAALGNYLPKNNPTFTGTMTGPAYNKVP